MNEVGQNARWAIYFIMVINETSAISLETKELIGEKTLCQVF